jgi:hypothetical protein
LELAASDETFCRFLEEKGVDPTKLDKITGHERAKTIRKINPLVVARSAFRTDDRTYMNTTRRSRSRKSPDLYKGAHSLFAMLEGNPRWLIGVCNNLISMGSANVISIPASRQNKEVSLTIARYRSLLTTIPALVNGPHSRRGLLPLLDTIGAYFFARVVVDDFNPDPPLTFVVESRATPALLDALGRALNAGAIIYVPDSDNANILSSLKRKRFRLSYVFASHYSLPLRLGRHVLLETILRTKTTDFQDSLWEAENG